MGMESHQQKQPQEDHARFFSNDPFKILGVTKESSFEDIKKAKRRLQSEFHPDRNKDEKATEIIQNVNKAYGLLEKLNKYGAFSNARKDTESRAAEGAPPRPSANERPKSNTYEQPKQNSRAENNFEGRKQKGATKETVEVEKGFYSDLEKSTSSAMFGPKHFTEWVSRAEAAGINSDRIKELVRSAEAQKIFKKSFISEAQSTGGGWNASYPGPENLTKYIQQWKEVGIDLSSHLKSPEVSKALADRVTKEIKQRQLPGDDSGDVLRFVESWKKAGVDLSGAIGSKENIDYLTTKIALSIRGDGGEGGHFASPEYISSSAVTWKKAGIDLGDLFNSPQVEKALTDTTTAFLHARNGMRAKGFVQKWMKVGWKPNQEILSAINAS